MQYHHLSHCQGHGRGHGHGLSRGRGLGLGRGRCRGRGQRCPYAQCAVKAEGLAARRDEQKASW
jgi:hypothetical protein